MRPFSNTINKSKYQFEVQLFLLEVLLDVLLMKALFLQPQFLQHLYHLLHFILKMLLVLLVQFLTLLPEELLLLLLHYVLVLKLHYLLYRAEFLGRCHPVHLNIIFISIISASVVCRLFQASFLCPSQTSGFSQSHQSKEWCTQPYCLITSLPQLRCTVRFASLMLAPTQMRHVCRRFRWVRSRLPRTTFPRLLPRHASFSACS